MEQKKMTTNVLNDFCLYTSRIPNWIKGTSKIHRKIWDEMSCINDGLKNLFVNAVLSEYKLNRVHMNINHHIELIEEIMIEFNEDLGMDVQIYYIDLFDDLIEIAVENEEFEIAQNLTKYKEIYVK